MVDSLGMFHLFHLISVSILFCIMRSELEPGCGSVFFLRREIDDSNDGIYSSLKMQSALCVALHSSLFRMLSYLLFLQRMVLEHRCKNNLC